MPLAALTAWQVLTAATTVRPGQRVLIHAAAGGVGHFAVQLAKHRGAHVMGTARSAKHAWLRGSGRPAGRRALRGLPRVFAAAEAAGKRAMPFLVEPDGTALAEIATLIDHGKVRVEVAEVFPLDQAAAAHRSLATGRTQGKIVLKL